MTPLFKALWHKRHASKSQCSGSEWWGPTRSSAGLSLISFLTAPPRSLYFSPLASLTPLPSPISGLLWLHLPAIPYPRIPALWGSSFPQAFSSSYLLSDTHSESSAVPSSLTLPLPCINCLLSAHLSASDTRLLITHPVCCLSLPAAGGYVALLSHSLRHSWGMNSAWYMRRECHKRPSESDWMEPIQCRIQSNAVTDYLWSFALFVGNTMEMRGLFSNSSSSSSKKRLYSHWKVVTTFWTHVFLLHLLTVFLLQWLKLPIFDM